MSYNPNMTPEELRNRTTITVEEAGELLGLSRNSAFTAAGNGEIPTLRFGKRLVVPVPKLLAMLGVPDDAPELADHLMSEHLVNGLRGIKLTADEADALIAIVRSRVTGEPGFVGDPELWWYSLPARERPLESLGLPNRAHNCISRMTDGTHKQVRTVGDLADCTEYDLLSLRNFGEDSLLIVQKALAEVGLSLTGPPHGKNW
jgi:hypothetical protein